MADDITVPSMGSLVALASRAAASGFQIVGPREARYIKRAEQRRARIMKAAKVKMARLRAEVVRLDRAISRASADLEACHAQARDEDRRPYQAPFSRNFYALVVAILVALETPLTKSALDHLRSSEQESWAIALFLASMNFLAAKMTARCLRQNGWADRAWRDWGIAAALNVVLVGALWQLGALRSLASAEQASGPIVDAGLALFTFQATAYLAVLLLSFYQTDPDRRSEQLARRTAEYARSLHALRRERRPFADAHNAIYEAAVYDLEEEEDDCIERCLEYRDGNMRHRAPGDAPPDYFRRSIARNVFRPITHELGVMIDVHPRTSGEVTAPILVPVDPGVSADDRKESPS